MPLIWSSGDLAAGMGSSQTPRNSPGSPTWEISLVCMGHLDVQVDRAPSAHKGSAEEEEAGLGQPDRSRSGCPSFMGMPVI